MNQYNPNDESFLPEKDEPSGPLSKTPSPQYLKYRERQLARHHLLQATSEDYRTRKREAYRRWINTPGNRERKALYQKQRADKKKTEEVTP